MTNEEILANAPEGATHIEMLAGTVPYYLKHEITGTSNYHYYGRDNGWSAIRSGPSGKIRSLSDIRRIVELEKYNLGLATESHELQQKLEAAERERDELKASIEKFTTGIDELTADYLYSGDDTTKINCELKVRGNFNSVESLESFLVDHLRQQLNGGTHE